MSLQPQAIPPVPEETSRVVHAAFPKGNRYMRMRDELGVFFSDQAFAHLYPHCGHAAQTPWRLALITIMQFAENLSDRQAAEAVRARIDWKYALSLELTDTGFDFSVLSEFRDRLRASGAEQQLLEIMLQAFQQKGLLKAHGRQRTDSTHVLAKVRDLTRLELIGETLRHTLNTIAKVEPDWLRAQVPDEWYDRYGKRLEEAQFPKTPPEWETLASKMGADGFRLLDAIYADETPTPIRALVAVETLRQVWLQQFYAPTSAIQLRATKDSPPGALRIRSPQDLEARYSAKRSTEWTGYKVHLTESCDDFMPRLLTHVETTEATTADQEAIPRIHQALKAKERAPHQHIVDQGYTSAHLLVHSQQGFGIDLLSPVARNSGWQAKAKDGFDLAHFEIDWKRKVVRCPNHKRSHLWTPGKDSYGKPIIHIEFKRSVCLKCPMRSQCTRSKEQPRNLTIKVQEEYQALEAARERQKTEEFKQAYAIRAGIEGTIAQGVRSFDLRQCRYIGLSKAHFQHIATAAAINLVRILAWLEGIPLAKTRRSHFAKLATANG
ncbi:IS1182 family transposase [Phormidium sp. FACHB-592]|uniref:IS1182 family transposase n=1 Tax=Stenomitos frigidus AS-A4 TaxID=2933935 RepID=A0ABV0KSJ9_9CYAN|nr:IS1182 family transposase [Phormidium sp. FACHB-592]MBD2077244.1 IS1182 family transposase [Phormidium sp. FACHB-592]